jgi:DNA (cytosine-5)-methyltransferase 1
MTPQSLNAHLKSLGFPQEGVCVESGQFMTRAIHRAVSLFSNCGAGDVGYARAGFRFDVMAELDPRRLEVCLLNHPAATGVAGDLRDTWKNVVTSYRAAARQEAPSLLAACPPCQGMSTARSDRGREDDADAGTRDSRNLLVTVISLVAKELRPHFVVVENVQAFFTRKVRHPVTKQPVSAARLLVDDLDSSYTVFPVLADLCDFGVPQTRKRAFLTFIRKDSALLEYLDKKKLTPYPIPKFASDHGGKPKTIREAFKAFNLPPLDASSATGASSQRGRGLHAVPVWADRRYAMVAAIRKNSGGSAWETSKCEKCGKVDVGPLAAICPRCDGPLLRPVVKARNGRYRLIHGFRSSTYSRMKSDSPSATITTASGHIGSNNTIHPFENRLLSALECSLLQTISPRFKWGDALKRWGHTNVREMIGEAVPPLFTELHGRIIMSILEGRRVRRCLHADNVRSSRARKRLGVPVPKLAK